MAELPSGTITFLFSDIEGSTPLWDRNPRAMQVSLARHNAILQQAIQTHDGQVFKTIGDAFQVAFTLPAEAVAAAVQAQRALTAEDWSETGPIRVRMGIHSGPAEVAEGDYLASHTLNRVARIMSAGHGGQILLSAAAADQVRGFLPEGASLRDLGEHFLKGLAQPERIFQVLAAELQADFPPLVTRVTPRGYKLLEQIGAGGFGAVYRALQPEVGREVAVKVILPQFANDPEFIRRFEAEAQLVARLEHPHIVPLYDYWREPDSAYLVMRLLRGGSLEALLAHGPLSLERAGELIDQITDALDAAHRQGTVHRDLKPVNILLDESGNFYLSDFGIAKNIVRESELTRPGSLIGSPLYMSPEQMLGGQISPQADLYSLGVVLFEVLVGERPFVDDSPVRLIDRQLHDPLPSASQRRADLPKGVDAVIQRATAKDPGERFPDALSFAAAFRAALSGVPLPGIPRAVEGLKLANPYKGLRAFQEADADDFFGREALVERLLARLSPSGDAFSTNGQGPESGRFLAMVGPSGSGKSSAVRAGLLPALRRGALPGSDNWFLVELIPGAHPLEELEAALLRVAVNPPASLLAQLQEDQRGLVRAVKRILPTEETIELLLIVDQFEEIFTLVDDPAETRLFLESLYTAVSEPRSRLRIVITLRADFYDRPLMYPGFSELVRHHTEAIVPLTAEELSQAITEPAQRVGIALEEGLVAAIVAEVNEQPGALPLMQYALTELFERREGRLLTQKAYHEIGGVTGALGRRAEEIFVQLDAYGQETARQLFLRLVTLGEGVEDTRRRVLRFELEGLEGLGDRGKGPVEAVLEAFGRARLLSFDRDPLTRGPTVEVAHEALLREWRRLRGWLDESREEVRQQRRLGLLSQEWIQANQEASFLVRGARLEGFKRWAANTDLALTRDEQAYLEASLAERRARRTSEAERQAREAKLERRSRNFLRGLVAVFAVAAVVALFLSLFAFRQRDIAENNFVSAERVRLAAQAQIALDRGEGGDLPALLALRSLQLGYSPEADAALLNALRRGFIRQQYLGHADDVNTIAFSLDGRHVLTGSADRTARLWDAQTGEELRRFTGHAAALYAAIFSPDARYILTASVDNTARLWDTQSGEELHRFTGHAGGVYSADFTADGQHAITSDGTLARLWDVQAGTEVRQFSGHTGTIWWADISPDDRYLATASDDQSVRLWDLQTGQELRQFPGHTDWVGGVRFSPDGKYILTTSADRTARLWDIQTGQEMRRFVGHTDALFDGSFSPDGRYVLTSSYDKTARLWDIASGQEVRQFLGHTDFVGAVIFSLDGQFIVTGSGDRTARLWDMWPETEPRTLASFAGGHFVNLYSVDISSDQRYLLTGRTDGAVQLWQFEPGHIVREIAFGAVTVNALAVSADGHFVLTGDAEGVVRLAEAETGDVVREFLGHQGPVWDVGFSPDGQTILSGGDDATARLWETKTGRELHRLSGDDGAVRSLAFSPDGRFVLSGSDSGTARLWEIKTGRQVSQFGNHSGAVLDLAYSPDGRFILTGSEDNIARLWDVEDGREERLFIGHTAQVSQVAFSPDGRYVLTGSADQTARLWDAETEQEVRRFVGHASPLQFVAFSTDGQSILTGDIQAAYRWRTSLEDVIAFTCAQLPRDLTNEEKVLYSVSNGAATCAEFIAQTVEVQPTWTPVLPGTLPISPLALQVEMEFLDDVANIQMGVPVLDVFVDAGNGQVVRPEVLNAETLALPLYSAAVEVELDFFEAPFEVGPFPKGEPLGFTLGEWIAATGRGTYTLLERNRAQIELSFEELVPSAVYTVWCVELSFANATMVELPCGSLDGSENTFVTDENGDGEITMEIDAFPSSTEEIIYEIAIAYHSDGRTYGESPGKHGFNVHAQMYYDFLPPTE